MSAATGLLRRLLIGVLALLLPICFQAKSYAVTTKTVDSDGIVRIMQSKDSIVYDASVQEARSESIDTKVNAITMLRSSFGTSQDSLKTFDSVISDNMNTDFTISESMLSESTLPVTINTIAAESNTVKNQVKLNAASGNAVHAAIDGGNAKSGNVSAIANVLSVIDTTIETPRSFIGNITIGSNFTGDIKVPKYTSLTNPLSASNVSESTPLDFKTGSFTTNDNTSIKLAAKGGEAIAPNISHTDRGVGNTNLTVHNITGNKIIGSNCLLVFVNVLGSWTGLIANMPSGTKSAAIGDNTFSNIDSTTSTNSRKTDINNTLDVTANSGNAYIANNLGTAHSGKANASVALGTISNSDIRLTDWFGVLFINVLGDWKGNIAITDDTEKSTMPPPKPSAPRLFTGGPLEQRITSTANKLQSTKQTTNDSTDKQQQQNYVLGSNDVSINTASPTQIHEKEYKKEESIGSGWVIASIIALGMLTIIIARQYNRWHRA